MTHEERTAVHIASKAGGRGRQHWPKDVVGKFLAAEVITAAKVNKTVISLGSGHTGVFQFVSQFLWAGGFLRSSVQASRS